MSSRNGLGACGRKKGKAALYYQSYVGYIQMPSGVMSVGKRSRIWRL